jgi:hypothetical protein
MAEILQQETQEAQALRSKASPFTAKAHAPQPLREAGYNKRLEADNWGKANIAMQKSAKVVKSYTLAKDKVAANETIESMNSDHDQVMLNLTKNLHQTDLENLDLMGTVAGFENRHNEPFKIGQSDSKGKPSATIHSQKLEDYNLPHSQKDALEKHYNALEKQKTDFLIKSLPEILIGKAKFQLNTKTQELKNQVEAITLIPDNYITEMSEGESLLWDADSSRDLSPEQVKEMGEPATAPSVYTLNLTPQANKDLLELFKNYDKELIDVLQYGVISAEEAIVFQRNFTQDVLKMQFEADASRDEDGAYLKLKNGGYHIERDLLWGTSYSKKLKQIIHIDEKNSGPWVDQFRLKKQKERIKAEKLDITNEKKSGQEDFARVVQNPDSFTTLTYKDVVNGFVTEGTTEYLAKQYANAWEMSKLAYDGKAIDGNATFQLDALRQEIATHGDRFEERFAFVQDDGQTFSIKGPKLQKALVTLAEDRLKLRKYNAMSVEDQGNTQPERITLTKDERTNIGKAAKKINSGHIQKMLNTRAANKRDNIKEFTIKSIANSASSDIGKADLKERYLKLDVGRGTYGVDHTKVEAVWENAGFDSNVEFAKHLTGIAININAASKAAAAKLLSGAGVTSEFMPDKMFKGSMQNDSDVYLEMLTNIASGSTNSFRTWSGDPSKSFFEVNAVAYLNTPKGQKDKNFQARYKKGVQGLLSTYQQDQKNRMMQGYAQLYIMEEALIPSKNTTKEVLKGYYEELLHDKSKRGIRSGKYTHGAALNIQGRLLAAITKLEPQNVKGHLAKNCYVDGALDDACLKKWQQDQSINIGDVNGSVSRSNFVFSLVNQIGGIEDIPDEAEVTGEGANR